MANAIQLITFLRLNILVKVTKTNMLLFFLTTDLTDNLVLEKTVSELRSQLGQSHERERDLQTKTDELETLPVKVDELLKQVTETES